MSITPLTVPPKKLAQTISASAMSFKLNNIKGWKDVDLVPGDFGTEAYGVFINSTRTQIEIFKFDPSTIASSSITIIARGLGYSGGDTEDASRKFAWPSNDTTVQLGTDAPQLFRDFLSSSNDSTISAKYTFDTELPESDIVPSDPEDLVNKAYVDNKDIGLITFAVNQTAHGFVVGDVLRQNGTNTYAKAQADTAEHAEVIGIVTTVVDADNFEITTEGSVTTGVPAVAANTILFLSPTVAGALTATEPTTVGQWNVPLAVVRENGAAMTFHKYKKAELSGTISGVPLASETVAGIVEEATQAEVDAEADTGGTGAKLFVPPSKLPRSGVYEVFNAYEDISAGDAVGLSHFIPLNSAVHTGSHDNFYTDVSGSVWYAQKFKFDSSWEDVSSVQVYVQNTDNDLETYTVKIRSTLTGVDIDTKDTQVGGFFSGYVSSNSLSGLLTKGNEYWVLVKWTTDTGTGLGVGYDSAQGSPPTGITGDQVQKSTDTGATWGVISGVNLDIRINATSNGALGHYEVFKSSAAALDNRFGFIGYAVNAATAGNPVRIDTRASMDIFTGLTANRKYYLSDTPGAISLTPGTIRLELGRSVSTTQLVRGVGEQCGNMINLGIGTKQFSQQGLVTRLHTGSSNFVLYDRVDVDAGEVAYTRTLSYSNGRDVTVRVRPGDQVATGGSVAWFIPIITAR